MNNKPFKPYFWNLERQGFVKEALQGAGSWDEVVYRLSLKDIKTNVNALRRVTELYNIERPVFPCGGDRRSQKFNLRYKGGSFERREKKGVKSNSPDYVRLSGYEIAYSGQVTFEGR